MNELQKVLSDLIAKCDEDADYALAVYAVCLVLIRQLSVDQPIAVRQAWAIELYKVADKLAEHGEFYDPFKDDDE